MCRTYHLFHPAILLVMVAMVGMGAQFLAQEPHHGVEPLQSREQFYDHNVVAMTMAHMRLFVDKDGSLPHPFL